MIANRGERHPTGARSRRLRALRRVTKPRCGLVETRNTLHLAVRRAPAWLPGLCLVPLDATDPHATTIVHRMMRTHRHFRRIRAMMRAISSTTHRCRRRCAPLPGQQQVPAAEHVERQVAELIIIVMEEAAFLPAVQRPIGVVEVEHDLARRTHAPPKKLDQQFINPRPVAIDLVILRSVAPRRVLRLSVLLPARYRLMVGLGTQAEGYG